MIGVHFSEYLCCLRVQFRKPRELRHPSPEGNACGAARSADRNDRELDDTVLIEGELVIGF